MTHVPTAVHSSGNKYVEHHLRNLFSFEFVSSRNYPRRDCDMVLRSEAKYTKSQALKMERRWAAWFCTVGDDSIGAQAKQTNPHIL